MHSMEEMHRKIDFMVLELEGHPKYCFTQCVLDMEFAFMGEAIMATVFKGRLECMGD